MGNKAKRDNKKDAVGLMGQGLVYQHVQRHVESMYQVVPLANESSSQQLATCKIMVYCCDTWAPGTVQDMNRRCLQARVAFLPVYTQFGEGIIGPCVFPREKGCASCAELRKLGATISRSERELLQQYLHEEREPLVSQPWLSSFGMEMLAALVGEEVSAYFQRPDQIRTDCALLSISLETLDCRRHTFLPLSTCPDCGALIDDAAEMAVIALQSCPKPDAFTYRTRQPKANVEGLFSAYVDERTGLVCSLTTKHKNLLPITSSLLSFETQDGGETIGTGCALRAEQSKMVSILESLERYAGLRSRSKRAMVRASYHQLVQQGQQVLDPTTLGLHTPERYEQHSQHHCREHMVAYHHDLVGHWIWGYSFLRQSPLLVPEHCAYYSVEAGHENPLFLYETSNGCALGNCLEEAIFHGIMEVVERDAFLLTWYAQLSLSRLNLLSVTDPMVRLLIKHLEYHSDYTIHAFNATLDHAIPCLCVLGIDEQNREGTPKVHVAAGSHPHPEQALFRALRELTTSLDDPLPLSQEKRAEALELLADVNRVQTMQDHPLVYYLPEAFECLSFLYHTQRQQTFQEAFSDFYRRPPEHMDLQDDLERLIGYYLKRNIDVIVVDQTAPEQVCCGLHCVKVIIPGMLPMTFGQHNRRITGFERLHQLPFTLGYRSHPLTEAEINP